MVNILLLENTSAGLTRIQYNGIIIAKLFNDKITGSNLYPSGRISNEEIVRLKAGAGYKEIYLPELKDNCYEFISQSPIPGTKSACIGRLIFSKSFILAPIEKEGEELTYLVLENGLGCVLREPDMKTAEECMKHLFNSDFIESGKVLLDNCWLCGDDEINKKPMTRISACITAAKSFNGILAGDLKKN